MVVFEKKIIFLKKKKVQNKRATASAEDPHIQKKKTIGGRGVSGGNSENKKIKNKKVYVRWEEVMFRLKKSEVDSAKKKKKTPLGQALKLREGEKMF